MTSEEIKTRLEELRTELRNERISYGELAELQTLAEYIEADDTELLEAAGIPEGGFVSIKRSSLEDLLSEIQYAIAPYFDSDDQYEDFHWSRTLKAKMDEFLKINDLTLEA